MERLKNLYDTPCLQWPGYSCSRSCRMNDEAYRDKIINQESLDLPDLLEITVEGTPEEQTVRHQDLNQRLAKYCEDTPNASQRIADTLRRR
jgi:hypothetical protein